LHELVLIFADLFIAPGASNSQSVPALPALSTLLARGQARFTGDWRGWVLCEYGGVRAGRLPVAAAARLVTTPELQSASRHWWLATPVHLDAGLTEVRMADELPALDLAERDALVSDFNRLFAAQGLQLDAAGGAADFLISSPWNDAATIDPFRLSGQNIEAALPTGPDAAQLRRLMTEVQMWLHDHVVNQRRAWRGQPTVNALWIWGGGGELPVRPAALLPTLATDEPFLVGLWKLWKGPLANPADSFAAMRVERFASTQTVLACVAAARSPAQALETIERDWMRPALSALRRGVLRRVRLHVNDRLFAISRLDSYRFWRARSNWLDAVAT
jgi:hypothetical protein